MRAIDIVKFGLKSLFERKTRSSLTILGILIGPIIIVAITGTIQGFSYTFVHQIIVTYSPNDIIITPRYSGTLTPYIIQQVSTLPGVKIVAPYYLIPAYITSPRGNIPTVIFSMNPNYVNLVLPGLKLENGSYPQGCSFEQVDAGYYISHPQYPDQPIFTTGNIITVYIDCLNGNEISKTFFVVGELQEISSFSGADFDNALFAPASVGQSIYGDQYSGAVVVAQNPSEVNEIANQIEDQFGNYVKVETVEQFLSFLNKTVILLEVLLLIAGTSSLVVAFIGVLSTMITTVVERTKEIGLLMALGYTKRQVLLIFIVEALLMGIIGGAIGIILGYFGSFVLSDIASNLYGGTKGLLGVTVIPYITIPQLLEIFVITAIISGIAGIVPAYRASKTEPSKALRYEV